jgi:hypothetical protein
MSSRGTCRCKLRVAPRVLSDIGEVPVLPDEFIRNARFSRRAASRINGHNSRRKQVFPRGKCRAANKLI